MVSIIRGNDDFDSSTVYLTSSTESTGAWANFNGVGSVSLRDSGNMSSITDNAGGDYTLTMTTAMPNNTYVTTFGSLSNNTANNVTVLERATSVQGTPTSKTSSAVRLHTGLANQALSLDISYGYVVMTK